MLIMLRTLCGCQRYLEVGEYTSQYIDVPLRMPFRPGPVEFPTGDTPILHARRFQYDGVTRDGLKIYTEVLDE